MEALFEPAKTPSARFQAEMRESGDPHASVVRFITGSEFSHGLQEFWCAGETGKE